MVDPAHQGSNQSPNPDGEGRKSDSATGGPESRPGPADSEFEARAPSWRELIISEVLIGILDPQGEFEAGNRDPKAYVGLLGDEIRFAEILAGVSPRATAEEISLAALEIDSCRELQKPIHWGWALLELADRNQVRERMQKIREALVKEVRLDTIAEVVRLGGGALYVAERPLSSLPPVYLARYPGEGAQLTVGGFAFKRVERFAGSDTVPAKVDIREGRTPIVAASEQELAIGMGLSVVDVYQPDKGSRYCYLFPDKGLGTIYPWDYHIERGPLVEQPPILSLAVIDEEGSYRITDLLQRNNLELSPNSSFWRLPESVRALVPGLPARRRDEHAAMMTEGETARWAVIKDLLVSNVLGGNDPTLDRDLAARVADDWANSNFCCPVMLVRAASARARATDLFWAATWLDRLRGYVNRTMQASQREPLSNSPLSVPPLDPQLIAEVAPEPRCSVQAVRRFVEGGGGVLYRADRDMLPPLYLACTLPAPDSDELLLGDFTFSRVGPLEPGQRDQFLTVRQLQVSSREQIELWPEILVLDFYEERGEDGRPCPGKCIRDARSDLTGGRMVGRQPMATFWSMRAAPDTDQAATLARRWFDAHSFGQHNRFEQLILGEWRSGCWP